MSRAASTSGQPGARTGARQEHTSGRARERLPQTPQCQRGAKRWVAPGSRLRQSRGLGRQWATFSPQLVDGTHWAHATGAQPPMGSLHPAGTAPRTVLQGGIALPPFAVPLPSKLEAGLQFLITGRRHARHGTRGAQQKARCRSCS